MSKYYVEASQVIEARAADIYSVLADYQNGHPHILPKKYFKKLEVLEGGTGAGTQFRVVTQAMGKESELRMVVSEPKPGSILVETDTKNGIITTFTVTPLKEELTKVQFVTEWQTKAGVAGFIEKIIIPMFARRVYKQELNQLAAFMKEGYSTLVSGSR